MKKTKLRTEKTYTLYLTSTKKKDFIKKAPSLREFRHWRVIKNDFPYDEIAKTHHMLVPKRRVMSPFYLTGDEKDEFEAIITKTIVLEYDMIIYNFPKRQTVPDWLHYHLLILK